MPDARVRFRPFRPLRYPPMPYPSPVVLRSFRSRCGRRIIDAARGIARYITVGDVVIDRSPRPPMRVAKTGAAAKANLNHAFGGGQCDEFTGAAVVHDIGFTIEHHAAHAASGMAAEQARRRDADAFRIN